jgi:lactate dehydrogenase-like 2-hydroxyacid dehydrogenase
MRAKVVCLRPKHDFDRAMVAIPDSFDMRYFPQFEEEAVIREVIDADFILTPSHSTLITAKLISQAKSLKMIQVCGAGYDNVDVEAAKRAGIPVARSADQNSKAVAQLAFTLITILNRGIVEADREIKKGNYQAVREKLRREGAYELEGLHLGILGIGPIGKEMAKIGAFFGAKLYYHDIIRLSPEDEKAMKLTFLEFADFLKIADILTLHIPLNDKTRNIIGRKEFALMKDSALLINTSRGGVLDNEALIEALKSNRLRGAALDAFDPEPLPPDHPFLRLDPELQNRLILTPHLGGVTKQSQRRMLQAAMNNILMVMRGETPNYIVNLGKVLEN